MSTPKLFDVHTHTQFAAFTGETDTVIKRALDNGVWLTNVGTQKDTSAAAIEVAGNYSEGVYATVGLHPTHTEASYHDKQELGILNYIPNSRELENKGIKGFTPLETKFLTGFTSREEDFDYDYYKNLAQNPKVAAIGECGLDYYRLTEETKTKQREVFIKQIELAREVGKPLMIHCRNAFSDLINILQFPTYHFQHLAGVIHFFTGTVDDAKKLLELGFSFSFGGVITFARDYDEQIKHIPLDRIVLETDAPYVSPVPYRGKRNEPAYITEAAKKIAEIKNVPLEEVAEKTFANARKIFKL